MNVRFSLHIAQNLILVPKIPYSFRIFFLDIFAPSEIIHLPIQFYHPFVLPVILNPFLLSPALADFPVGEIVEAVWNNPFAFDAYCYYHFLINEK